jgi:hypothetical protein
VFEWPGISEQKAARGERGSKISCKRATLKKRAPKIEIPKCKQKGKDPFR